jgi:hypothetical protein
MSSLPAGKQNLSVWPFALRTAVEKVKIGELTAEETITRLGKSPRKSSLCKVPTPSGPFAFQLYFEDLGEIDEICLEALKRQSNLQQFTIECR